MSSKPIIDEQTLWDLLDTVPLGNSQFQIENLVVNHAMTGRARRQILLELHEKARALHNAGCERERIEIKIRKKKKEIVELRKKKDSEDDIALLEVDIREMEFSLRGQQKLADDALAEVRTYLSLLEKMPDMTREEFEAQESEYWTSRLLMEARQHLTGTGSVPPGHLESLHKIGIEPELAMKIVHSDHKAKLAEIEKPSLKAS
jgi:hypothetical protein